MSKPNMDALKRAREYEDMVVNHIVSEVRKLPELPAGWEYELSFDQIYNYEINGWEYKVYARPVQKHITHHQTERKEEK